jgi:hypothetical protein
VSSVTSKLPNVISEAAITAISKGVYFSLSCLYSFSVRTQSLNPSVTKSLSFTLGFLSFDFIILPENIHSRFKVSLGEK